MKIAVGSDHAGFPLKAVVMDIIKAEGHEAIDVGTYTTESVDYPDFSAAVGRMVRDGEADRGVILCGSGVGAAVAANKLRGVRAGQCHDTYSAHQCVEHDDVNVLALGARVIGEEPAKEIVTAFLRARFTGEERHVRRLNKVLAIETEEFGGEKR
ncbi:MAG: ribose 5-phosphate isomerase B [Anaerolineales bacterium]|nr:ribose 5-phosphate isomerase B [Anaerolineales bacterium]